MECSRVPQRLSLCTNAANSEERWRFRSGRTRPDRNLRAPCWSLPLVATRLRLLHPAMQPRAARGRQQPSPLVYCFPRCARLRSVVIDPGTGRSQPTALSVLPKQSRRRLRDCRAPLRSIGLGLALLIAAVARAADLGLYERHCAFCHGSEGRGDGPVAGRLPTPPADFTSGNFKLRSTPSGAMPTDDDLAG